LRTVALAEKACALTDRKDPSFLDTLAAAYAEAGSFPEAVATAKEATALAKQNALPELAAAIDERLKLYESRKPYHEPRRPPQ
jgi:Flp pilus assembly protein TadD